MFRLCILFLGGCVWCLLGNGNRLCRSGRLQRRGGFRPGKPNDAHKHDGDTENKDGFHDEVSVARGMILR